MVIIACMFGRWADMDTYMDTMVMARIAEFTGTKLGIVSSVKKIYKC